MVFHSAGLSIILSSGTAVPPGVPAGFSQKMTSSLVRHIGARPGAQFHGSSRPHWHIDRVIARPLVALACAIASLIVVYASRASSTVFW